MVLGEFVAEIFRTAFGRAEVIGDAIKEAFGGQDWQDIGKEVGAIAVVFFKGFVVGLFAKPKATEKEFGTESKTIASRLADNFVGTMIGAFILARVPLIGGMFRGMFSLMSAGFMRLVIAPFLTLIGFKVPALLGVGILKAIAGLIMLVGKGIGIALAVLGHFVGKAIRVVFATLGGTTTARAMMAGQAIRTFFTTKFALLLRSGFAQALATFVRFTIPAIAKAAGAIIVGFIGWPAVIVAAAVAAITIFIIQFRKWFNTTDREFENIGSAIVMFIVQGFRKLGAWFNGTIIGWFRDRIRVFRNSLDNLRGDYENIGSAIIDGMVRGIRNKTSALREALVGAASNAWNATKKFLGIRSPSTLFEFVGMDMMEGLARGIDGSARIVQDAVGANSSLALNEARRFANMAASQRAAQAPAPTQNIVINVSGGLSSSEQIAREIEKVLTDSRRRAGGTGGFELII
jgi:hypothetical protein